MARNRRKVRAHLEGRVLRGKCKVTILDGGLFVYKGYVYDIDEFPEYGIINLDRVTIRPLFKHQKTKRKKKKNNTPKNEIAWLYSNLESFTNDQNSQKA